LPGARLGDVAAVHQARVATRRLREALPLLGPRDVRRAWARAARRLTRALGPVRELDVALATLGELAGDAPRAAIRCLADSIEEERARLQADLVAQIDRVHIDKLRRKPVTVADDAASGTQSRTRRAAYGAAARARAARRAVRLRAAIDSAAGMYVPERLHMVRIAVKKLRYALEIARDLSGSAAVARLRALRRAQDLLGRLYDLEVLIARTRAMQASARVPSLRLSADLDRFVRRLENETRQLHGRYMGLRAGLSTICDRVEHEAASRRACASAA
jgi:CHAD domain-containing protein